MVTLRPYQQEVIDAFRDAWSSGIRRPAAVAATGAGKTCMFARIVGEWSAANPGRRAVVLVHTGELVEQTVGKLRDESPGMDVGVVKASRDGADADVVVASVQTLMRPGRAERIENVGLVIVDECHHYAAKAWRRVMERFGCFDDDGPLVAGFTATMVRSDARKLSAVWDKVVADVDILTLIEAGYLCDVRAKAIEIDGLDLGTVARRGGDFGESALSDALVESNADEGIVKAYLEHGEGRQAGLFAPTVAFARRCAAAFDRAGVPAAVVSGDTTDAERAETYAGYRAEKTRILCNCMVLTEGFDMPRMACCIIARPTQSPGLYIQMVGRVLRPHPGKADALVLDVVGVTSNHSLVGLVDLSPHASRPLDGESLAQAKERVERERTRRGGLLALDDMTAREVDLFRKSSLSWKQTRKGVWFLATRSEWFVLWPYGETFRVLGSFSPRSGGRFTQVLGSDMTREQAVAFAEERARGVEMSGSFSVAARGASWRKRKEISPSMSRFATGLGIAVTDDMRAGDVSDAIDVELASRYIDPKIKEVG